MNFSTWLMGDCTQPFQSWILVAQTKRQRRRRRKKKRPIYIAQHLVACCSFGWFSLLFLNVGGAVFNLHWMWRIEKLVARTVCTAIMANTGGKAKLYGPENVFDRLMILVSDISAMHLDGKQHDAPTIPFTEKHNNKCCPFRLCSVWPSVHFHSCGRQRVAMFRTKVTHKNQQFLALHASANGFCSATIATNAGASVWLFCCGCILLNR